MGAHVVVTLAYLMTTNKKILFQLNVEGRTGIHDICRLQIIHCGMNVPAYTYTRRCSQIHTSYIHVMDPHDISIPTWPAFTSNMQQYTLDIHTQIDKNIFNKVIIELKK